MLQKTIKYSIPSFVFLIASGLYLFWSNKPVPGLSTRTSVEGKLPSSGEVSAPSVRQENRASIPRRRILDAGAVEARRTAKLWDDIAKEKTQYFDQFKTRHIVGLGRSQWLNSPEVCFWIDQLTSTNPDRVAIATKVFEKANLIIELANVKKKKEEERQFSQEEWESHLLFVEINRSRYLVQSSRFRANVGVNVEDSNAEESDLEKNGNSPSFFGDDDDSLVLKDAQPILEFFIPMLKSSDASVAGSAKSVIDTFTFSLFRDESPEWWENALIETKKRQAPKEHLFESNNP